MANEHRSKIEKAQHAHTDLNVFASLISILEGGTIYTHTGHGYSARIIRLCKEATQKLLRQMDDAVERAGGGRYGE